MLIDGPSLNNYAKLWLPLRGNNLWIVWVENNLTFNNFRRGLEGGPYDKGF